MQAQQELRKIIAGSSRFSSFLELLESKIKDVSNLDLPIKPTDSLEIRQAMKRMLQEELDVLRHIANTKNIGHVPVRRDDT